MHTHEVSGHITLITEDLLAGLAAARALAAVTPVAAGITAVRAALIVSVNNPLKPS